jgi:nucleoside-diphosphate-sugar epimerase
VELVEAGYNVVVLDNLSNSSTEAIRRIEAIVGKKVPFEQVDLTDFPSVKKVFERYPIDAVIHFAGLKVRLWHKRLITRRSVRAAKSHWSTIASMSLAAST